MSKHYLLLNKENHRFLPLDEAVLYFTLYSIFGWCYEVFLEVVVYRWGFSDRGVLTGPYCPVYGFGALAFLLLVYPLIRDLSLKERLVRIPLVFILSMLIATTLELATSYILEAATGSWPWQTYADYSINFQARIALSPSVRFGIGGVLFLYVLQPAFERIHALLVSKAGKNGARAAGAVLASIFVIDLIYTFFLK